MNDAERESRRPLRLRRRRILAAAAPVVLLVAATAYVQQKYEPIFAAPVITHEAVAKPCHTLRAVCYPCKAPEWLAKVVGCPERVVELFAPREVAVLAEPDLAGRAVRLSVFVNEQRLGPVIADWASPPELSKEFPEIAWSEQGCVRRERGSMVFHGTFPLKQEVVDLVRVLQKSASAGVAPPLEGGHMFEAALNNEDDGALAAFLCLYGCLDSGPPAFDAEVIAKTMSAVKTVQFFADFKGEDALEAQLVLTGWPEDEETMAELAFLTEVVRGEAARELRKDPYKMGFGGDTAREGSIVTVNLSLTGFAKFFEKEDEETEANA